MTPDALVAIRKQSEDVMLEMRAIARDQGTDDKAARKKLGDCIEKYFELGKREEGATDAIERQAIREASADDPNP